MSTEKKRIKHNWQALYEQYLKSDNDDLTVFLSQHIPNYKSTNRSIYCRNTKGWREEKAELRRLKNEQIKKDIATAHGWDADKLQKLKWDIITIVNNKLSKERETLNAYQLKALWEIVKTEAGEATKIEETKGAENKKPFSWYGE